MVPVIGPNSQNQVFQSIPNIRIPKETFGFAPGWSLRNLTKIDFTGLDTLAYYDLRIDSQGKLDEYSDGYSLYMNDRFLDLVQSARNHNVKIVLTFTLGNKEGFEHLFNDSKAEQMLVDRIIYEVRNSGADGANINFEFQGGDGATYRDSFSRFVKSLTFQMHEEIPDSQVSVSLWAEAINEPMYDLKTLGKTADKVFVMAHDFPTPERKQKELVVSFFESQVSQAIHNFSSVIPFEKLVLETAWYGNQKNYPFYETGERDRYQTSYKKDLLEREIVDRLLSGVPSEAKKAARKNLPLIMGALKKEGILSPEILAYALATIEHETAGTFEPIEEFGGRHSARRFGYEGGTNYFGRGFIQLTHLRNYQKMGERIGLGDKLMKNPNLALEPAISAHILAAFFKDNGIARLASDGDFVGARTPINPDWNGWSVAMLAYRYLEALSS